MLPAMVSDIAQKASRFSAAPSHSPQQEDKLAGSGSAAATASATKYTPPKENVIDTVNLSGKSLQASSSITKTQIEDTKKLEQKKETLKKVEGTTNMGSTSSRVQFVYDQKGTLMVRYMDSADRLIYQVPSELMMRLKEMDFKTGSSVDTKA